jgi:3-dehydroquinate synthase
MIKLTVGLPSQEYDILIKNGLLAQTANEMDLFRMVTGRASGAAAVPVALVTDENVWELYGKDFVHALANRGYDIHAIVIPPGEQNKSIEGLDNLYNKFADIKMKRNSIAIALGGGVVGDLCGFAAATYMRGIPYIQIPTTLLAQVDSSVGGKTAINLRQGKNLAGAFYQPRVVIIDTSVLDTLPERELRQGMAEVIKYGAIRSEKFLGILREAAEERGLEPAEYHITTVGMCCRIKADIVERDERETGERMLLNFGHTFGHAIEKLYDYEKYNHGEAVAIGMALAAEIGEAMGQTKPGTADELRSHLEFHGLETRCPCPPSELLQFIETDKKSRGDKLHLVLLRQIGKAFVKPVKFTELEEVVRKMYA